MPVRVSERTLYTLLVHRWWVRWDRCLSAHGSCFCLCGVHPPAEGEGKVKSGSWAGGAGPEKGLRGKGGGGAHLNLRRPHPTLPKKECPISLTFPEPH